MVLFILCSCCFIYVEGHGPGLISMNHIRLCVPKPNHFFKTEPLDTFMCQTLMKIDKKYFLLYSDSSMSYQLLFHEKTTIFILSSFYVEKEALVRFTKE